MSSDFLPLPFAVKAVMIRTEFPQETEEGVEQIRAGEEELIRRSLAGEEEAFSKLVKDNERFVFNLAYRMIGDRDEAFDLTQEVFISLYENLDRFRRCSSLRTWLYRVVMNRAINELKRKKRYSSPSFIEGRDPRPSPEKRVFGQELLGKIEEGLSLLSPEFRAVILLRDVEGLSYEEIAKVLSLRKGTVKSRLARAREEMRSFLRAYIEPHFNRGEEER